MLSSAMTLQDNYFNTSGTSLKGSHVERIQYNVAEVDFSKGTCNVEAVRAGSCLERYSPVTNTEHKM